LKILRKLSSTFGRLASLYIIDKGIGL